jgi:hypothetical protein
MGKSFKNQSGMVLVLAILIIATVLAAAVIFSNLIIREIQQSRLIDQSMQAYYLAESGAERALYQVRRLEAVKARECGLVGLEPTPESICDDDGYCSDTLQPDTVPCINQNESALTVRAGWKIEADNEQETSILLKKGQSFQIDLFSPAQAFEYEINAIKVDRDRAGLILYGEFTNLSNILRVGEANCLNQPAIFRNFLPSDEFLISSLDGQDIFANCAYSFKLNYSLKSPGGSVEEFTISVYDTTAQPDEQLYIPSRVVIDSQADFGRSRQRVRVKTPIRPPVSGLYDFVLFSEEPIVK